MDENKKKIFLDQVKLSKHYKKPLKLLKNHNMKKITRKNYYDYVVKFFPDFQESEIFKTIVVGDEELSYIVSNALYEWLIKKIENFLDIKKRLAKCIILLMKST